MYRNQSGEFVYGYWGLKGLSLSDSSQGCPGYPTHSTRFHSWPHAPFWAQFPKLIYCG